MVQCDGQRLTHQAAGPQSAVKPGHGAHLQDLRYAAALIADQPGCGAFKFDFRTCVGLVAQFVLQALDADGVKAAVGQDSRQKKAAESGWRLRQHQESVAHGCREKPFVPGQPEALSPTVIAVWRCLRRIGPHVRATLLFRHAHAHGYTGFFRKQLESRVVSAAREFGRPVGMDGRIAAQGRGDRVGHGDRAQDGRLELGEKHETCGPEHVRRYA